MPNNSARVHTPWGDTGPGPYLRVDREPLPRAFIGRALGCAGLLAAGVAHAQPLAFSNTTGGSVSFYGQLSPIYLGFDDGAKTFQSAADNNISNSLVGFYLGQSVGAKTEVQLHFETSLGAQQSSDLSQDGSSSWTAEKDDLRFLEIIVSGGLGRLFAGQGSMTTDGVPQMDLSGTLIAGYVEREDTAGSYRFRDRSGVLSDVSIGNAFNDYNGPRRFRLRYDTPSFHGLSLAVSYGVDVLDESDDHRSADVALSWADVIGDLKIAAAAGQIWIDGSDNERRTEWRMGSISVLHQPAGLSITLAAGAEPGGGAYGYGKLGLITSLLSVGDTAVSVDYLGGEDYSSTGSASRSWGVEGVQTIDSLNLEAYAAWVSYAYNDKLASYKIASSIVVGMRWSF